MNDIISTLVFSFDDVDYPIDIRDVNGNKWATSQQVGEALGNANIRDLISGLIEKKELKEGIHSCRLTLQMPHDTQPRKYLVLSHRGIIRVSMKSEGSRAASFRDWAEDVLYEVMMTGYYSLPGAKPKSLIPIAKEYSAALRISKGLGLKGRPLILSAVSLTQASIGVNCMELAGITEADLPGPKPADIQITDASTFLGHTFMADIAEMIRNGKLPPGLMVMRLRDVAMRLPQIYNHWILDQPDRIEQCHYLKTLIKYLNDSGMHAGKCKYPIQYGRFNAHAIRINRLNKETLDTFREYCGQEAPVVLPFRKHK